jgi:hypothetical protein
MTLEQMYREGYGVTFWELTGLLSGAKYTFLTHKVHDGRLRGVIARILMRALQVPRWALTQNINVVIQKQA